MDIKEYIESGVLEQYCIDMLSAEEKASVELMCLLYPEIKNELQIIEHALEIFTEANAILPKPELKNKVLDAISNMEKEVTGDINSLPLINKYSDYKNWLKIVNHLIPETFKGGKVIIPIQSTTKVTQLFMMSSTDFEDEVHNNLHESFLIIDGHCECSVGDKNFQLGPGGFTEIPLYVPHSIKILSPCVKAILQRISLE